MLKHIEECAEVSYVLSTIEFLAATDGMVDSDVDFELGRLGWIDGSDLRDFDVFAFHATTSGLAPFYTRGKASARPVMVVTRTTDNLISLEYKRVSSSHII